MSAAGRTFAVAELLESILQELDPRDLLFAQRVCKEWQTAIASSSKLQQLLFFRASSEQVITYSYVPKYSCLRPDVEWIDRDTEEKATPTRNPLLEPLFKTLGELSHVPYKDRLSAAWARPDASWRRMLVAQPPIKGILRLSWTGYGQKQSKPEFEPYLDGPTAGQLPGKAEELRIKLMREGIQHSFTEAKIVKLCEQDEGTTRSFVEMDAGDVWY
ncbi:Putative F-box domain-containing protein [Septoria linicola]|uniref:F-box domain-containing protein n=1 Tax=Septoria linicola TaxID=215465 RepID=A0A9Q9AXB2_9PEZI|nr:Putative F-box domain-containing protein [Septoria linicola]